MKKDRLQKSLEVFGLQAVIDAVREGKEFDKIFMEKGVNTGLAMELRALLKEYNIMFKAVPVEKLNRLTHKEHQGVFAFVSPVNFYKLGDVLMKTYEEGKSPIFLMLDRVTWGIVVVGMGPMLGNKSSRIVAWTFLSTEEQKEWRETRWK